MTELIKNGPIETDKDGKEWLPILISLKGVSQLNKIILGDQVDEDNTKAKELRKQVHDDCIELFKEFS